MKFIARVSAKSGRKLYQTGEHDSREAAAREAFETMPAARECATGYGYNGNSDVRWHGREDIAKA